MITISNKEFIQLAAYVKNNYGIHLTQEKKVLVTGRLQNVLIQNGFCNFTEYFNHIISDKSGEAAITLVNKLTTNHTFFMRETDHFTYFERNILPFLTSALKNKDLRIWSAGCSSGEEPYTLAMLIDEFFGKEKSLWDTKVLATDISSNVLEEAKKGIYSNEKMDTIPLRWKTNFFKQVDNGKFCIDDRIKNEVIFRKLNLMDHTFPFKRKFHVIFCRNVMIYFDAQTKIELVNKFYDVMEPGGYLFIGLSESLIREETKFKYVMPSVYKKE